MVYVRLNGFVPVKDDETTSFRSTGWFRLGVQTSFSCTSDNGYVRGEWFSVKRSDHGTKITTFLLSRYPVVTDQPSVWVPGQGITLLNPWTIYPSLPPTSVLGYTVPTLRVNPENRKDTTVNKQWFDLKSDSRITSFWSVTVVLTSLSFSP